MRLGLMQPYLFPYIGYFQLIQAVDKFVIYDDVNFIKQGWINRNRILLNGKEFLFTLPLEDASSFKKINTIPINAALYERWKSKLLKAIDSAYSKAPFYLQVVPVIDAVFSKPISTISIMARQSLEAVCHYLNISTEIVPSSAVYGNSHLSSSERVIDICHKERATAYMNPIGGKELYSKEDFHKNGIDLSFIKTNTIIYPQLKNDFVPGLSIIDVMMFNSPAEIRKMLNEFIAL
jgi:hypothetical protein